MISRFREVLLYLIFISLVSHVFVSAYFLLLFKWGEKIKMPDSDYFDINIVQGQKRKQYLS